MSVNFEGILDEVVTFDFKAGVESGKLVKMSENDTVENCAADDNFIGVCVNRASDNAGVKIKGFVTLTYATGSGISAPSVGYNKLVCASDSAVKVGASGREYLAVNVDTTAKTVTILL